MSLLWWGQWPWYSNSSLQSHCLDGGMEQGRCPGCRLGQSFHSPEPTVPTHWSTASSQRWWGEAGETSCRRMEQDKGGEGKACVCEGLQRSVCFCAKRVLGSQQTYCKCLFIYLCFRKLNLVLLRQAVAQHCKHRYVLAPDLVILARQPSKISTCWLF